MTVVRTAGCLRRARVPTGPRSPASCGRASGSPGARARPGDRPRASRCGPGRSSTPPASGPTTPRRSPTSAASSTCARPRASTWWCRGTGSSPPPGSSCGPRRACCSSSPGDGTGSSAPPTPTGRWTRPTRRPAPRDIDYLLEHVNAVLTSPLTREDVEGVYAGLRPLLTGESESTSKLSREHVVGHPVPGLVVVAGGKYTTYRVMAKDAVDEAARGLDSRVPESCTDQVPLLGADGYRALWNQQPSAGQDRRHPPGPRRAPAQPVRVLCARPAGHARGRIRRWLSRCRPRTTTCGSRRVYAVTHEGARHLDDVLARRTRISIESWDRGVSRRPARGRADGRRPGLGRRAEAAGDRPLPGARARPNGIRRPSPTTTPPRPPGSARRTSPRSADPGRGPSGQAVRTGRGRWRARPARRPRRPPCR